MADSTARSFTSGARLYRQVQKIVSKLGRDDPVFLGIAHSLGVADDSTLHFRALLALRKLFDRTISDIQESSLDPESKRRHESDVMNVRSAFTFHYLATKWAAAQAGPLNSERIERLAYVDSALQGSLGANVVIASELEELKAAINEIISELDGADLPEPIIKILRNKLETLIADIDHADLFGPEAVPEHVAEIIGQIAIRMPRELREKNTSLIGHLKKGLSAALAWANKAASAGRSAEYLVEKVEQGAKLLEFFGT